MSACVQCPACHTPLPPGYRGRCHVCGHLSLEVMTAQPPGAPRRRRVLVPAAVASIGLVALAGWFVVRGLPPTAAEQPVPPLEAVVSAAPARHAAAEAPLVETPAENEEPNDEEETVPARPAVPPAPVEVRTPAGPPPATAAPKPPEPPTVLVRRRSELSEDDLRKQLAAAPEFGLTPGTRQALVRSYRSNIRSSAGLGLDYRFDPFTLLRSFARARELPIRSPSACQISPREAATLGALAKKLHAYLDGIAPVARDGKRSTPNRVRDVLRAERSGKWPEWLRPEAVPAMVQILMAEDVPLRLLLVDMLAEIPGKPAAVALAQRAVFDLSPDVRKLALAALRDRPRADTRPVFVNALRYPWAPAADHAADALVALEDRLAAPLLVAQLGKPDPAAPFATGTKGASVREVVRLNHQANCLLCHAPSVDGNEPVLGPDPSVSIPRGGGGGWSSGPSVFQPLLVRADVQFLRQDFSVSFPVGVPGVAVQGQRFDFVVRTRPLKKGAERRAWDLAQVMPVEQKSYPQREAVLFALRALTGKDAGPTTEAWLELYPHADAEAEGARLSAALLKAAPEQREALLARYRDAKEDRYTEGLSRAIPHLAGKLQARACEALVGRLARLTPDQIRTHLQAEDDDELRHAAALACVHRADPESVPDLIGLLLDPEPEIAEGARKVLPRLTGEDFGPVAGAGEEERVAAAANWQAWWRRQANR